MRAESILSHDFKVVPLKSSSQGGRPFFIPAQQECRGHTISSRNSRQTKSSTMNQIRSERKKSTLEAGEKFETLPSWSQRKPVFMLKNEIYGPGLITVDQVHRI